MASSEEILEVAVVDAHNEILADSIADRRGQSGLRYGALDPLVIRPAGTGNYECSARAMSATTRWNGKWGRLRSLCGRWWPRRLSANP